MTVKKLDDLKKCPFCGLEMSIVEHLWGGRSFGYYIVCSNCHARTVRHTEGEKVVSLWNNRMQNSYDPRTHVAVPREITGEQKYACLGAFNESIEIGCPECDGENEGPECEICNGEGHYKREVPVEWSTCREIYKKMVKAGESKAT